MGLQPIDLQVMYTQSANVSKMAAGQQQTAQLSESMQQTKIIQENMEKATRVQETSSEQSKSHNVNEDGRGGAAYSGGNKKKSGESESQEENPMPKFSNLKESYLGTIIDITR